ncbi:MAG: hypothetical protein JST00_46805 [Deltaproteobacteria bacterium]|nr:hypothetical protein [Deltaproteobacteria bacterium]
MSDRVRQPSTPFSSLGTAPGETLSQESQDLLAAPCPKCGGALEAPAPIVTLATGAELVCIPCERRRRGRASAEQIKAVREFMLTPPDLLLRVLRMMGR